MKKVKKYYPGTESLYANTSGWSYGLGNNSGMTNPGNQKLNQTTTTSSSTIPTGSLPASGDISQLTNPLKQKASGGGFSDLMGGMKGMDIGGMASSLGGSIAMLINANKKKNPNPEVPYKNGTNMIKSKKSKLIKYQGGVTATDIIGPGPLDKLKEMSPEQIKSFNNYEDNKLAINRVNAMGTPVSPIAPKMASLNIPQQAPMSIRPNPVSAPEKLSRRGRKQEMEKQFKMLNKQDVEYMTPRTPTLGNYEIPNRKPLMKMVEQQPVTAKAPKMFDYNSAEAKGGYARALKGGKRDAKGNLIDMETGLIYKDTKAKKASVSPQPQPVKQKNVLSSQTIQDRGIAAPSDNTRVNVNVPSFRKTKQNNTSNSQDASQLFKETGRFQDGTKSVAKKVTKQDYLDAAAKMTPEQRRQFHELDAKGVKFKFGNLEYSGLQKGKGGGKAATAPVNTGNAGNTGNAAAQTPPQNAKKNTPAPQVEGGGQYSNVDWSGKSGFEWRNPLESIARPLVRIGVGASSKGLQGVGAGLVGELANVVADYTPKGTVNSVANNIQTMADAYNLYRGATNSSIDFKKLKPKEALEYVKNLWKNKMQMTGNPLPQMTKAGKVSAKNGQLNLPI
jgi:hypothetical protein